MALKNRIGTCFAGKYEQIRLLGEGSYGKAFLVESLEDRSRAVIKSIDLSKLSEEAKNDALQEGKILQSLEHPNIIKFRDFIKENPPNKSILYIVMDYADGGDLSQKIRAQKGKFFPESQIIDWFTQVCLAIKHIHDRKILHRDIKSQNIFLTHNGLVKLGDFGIAKCLTTTIDKAKTMVGTPYYLSPEIINSQPYDFKSDIWSLGVLLYEMCMLKMPFDAPNIPQLSMKIINCSYTEVSNVFSKDLRLLIKSMLNVNSNKRPTIKDILNNKLIKSRIKNFLTEVQFSTEFSHTILHKFNVLKSKRANREEEIRTSSKNYIRPIKKKEENKVLVTSSNKVKNYHYNKETIQTEKEIEQLIENLQPCGKEKEKGFRGYISGSNHHKYNPDRRDNLLISNDRKINQKVLMKKENSERNINQKISEGNLGDSNNAKNIQKRKKTDRSESRGSNDKNNNNLKNFIKRTDIQNFMQHLETEKEREIESQKINDVRYQREIKELGEYMETQKMLLEYDKLQKEDANDISDSFGDDFVDEESYAANYNIYKGSQLNEKAMDEKLKATFTKEIGKDILCDFVKLLKQFINPDILTFDFDEITDKLKKEFKKKNVSHQIIEKVINRIPEIYYLVLKNKF